MAALLSFVLALPLSLFAAPANAASLDTVGDPLLSPKGINYEVAALMAVKERLQGDPKRAMAGWDINSVDPCTWAMVGCSADGFVVALEMASNDLSGKLSPSIGNLSHLQTMLIQNNKISGPIPSEIGKLSQLQILDLSNNQFDGEIPSSLGHLSRLSYLRLDRNNISGHIPIAVANLSGLSFLDLSFNNLSGSIPKILANGYSLEGNLFLCNSSIAPGCTNLPLQTNEAKTSQPANKQHRLTLVISLSVVCTVVVFILMAVCWLSYCRWRLPFASDDQDLEFELGHLKHFSLRELQNATKNFDPKNILGHGGFGIVYKGYLSDGSVVAVKRLKDPDVTGEVQFQTEVEMIGLAVHRNLLRLYGFCMTANERLLVYPFMSNGSVADRLRDRHHGEPSLDWQKRMVIALGAARGLLYLHEQCNPKIIHRDVKAANILLDDKFEAIVGDFGLAKLLDRQESHVTTAVRGTIGYIAPEYLSTGQSSEKTDVYSFGILLLELIAGPKALSTGHSQFQKGTALDWVKELKQHKKLNEVVEKDLRSTFNAAELETAIEVVLHCTQTNPSLRPRMSEVLDALEAVVGSGEQSGTEMHRTVHQEARCSVSVQPHEVNDNPSSFIIEAIELSGPR